MIDDCRLFCDVEGVTEGEHMDRKSKLHALGASSNGAGNGERGGHDGTIWPEVRFTQPDGVQTVLLGGE